MRSDISAIFNFDHEVNLLITLILPNTFNISLMNVANCAITKLEKLNTVKSKLLFSLNVIGMYFDMCRKVEVLTYTFHKDGCEASMFSEPNVKE